MKKYLIVLAFLLSSLAVSAQDNSVKTIVLQTCEVPGPEENSKLQARCGTLLVPEDRRVKGGRQISLKIIVFPATGSQRLDDPVFYLAGGPGSAAASEEGPYVAAESAKIRERRDLVFVDQRGTGGSNGLDCELFDKNDLQSFLGHWNPPDTVRECRQRLEKSADLRLYVTSIAMDDLDAVRKALGYKKINLMGGSYGTRAAQEYVRRYGKNVRAAVLHGVSLASQFMPRDFPQDTQRALDGVVGECLADAACKAAFPDLQNEVKQMLETLLKGSVEVEITIPQSDKKTRVKLSRDLAAEAVRYMLYQSGSAGRLPLLIHLAAGGNFAPAAESALFYRQVLVGSGSTGMYLSVTCAEDLPWIAPGVGERIAVGTFLGDYRLRQQREACAEWPRGEIPKDYSKPVRSEVPALILSGQFDPVTPPSAGEAVAKRMPNSLHIVVPSGGHGFGGLSGLECIDRLTAEFIERGSAKNLDVSCVKSIRRPGFMLKEPAPQR